MILNGKHLAPGAEIACDVCVVGSGAGGITAAHELRNSGLDVVLLEAGGRRMSARNQDVFRGEVLDTEHHGELHLYRHRRYSGTTPVWGGRCAPFDEVDYSAREHVPFSGWPVDRAHMDPYCARANEYCEAGAYAYLASQVPEFAGKELIPGFRSDAIHTDFIWRFSLPTDFAREFGAALEAAPKMRVILNGGCVKLHTTANGQTVEWIEAASSPERRFKVKARHYILAAGGLETARLLLASDDEIRGGIGNQRDMVGRFYISHMTGDAGEVHYTPRGGDLIWDYERTADGVYCRRAFSIRPEVQKAEGLMNFRAILSHPSIADPRHGNGILSAMYMVKRFLVERVPPEYSKALSNMKPVEQATGHARNILFSAGQLTRFAHTWLTKRILSRRKLPSVTVFSKSNTYTLHYDGEQAPNPDSRITLSDQRDAYGIRRLRVDWRFQPLDVHSVVRSCELIAKALKDSGTGEAYFTPESVKRTVIEKSGIGSHHIGTTRMAADPSRGVVDTNCKVFGVDNLFIASSSVFPTAGYANPTLMIVAMGVKVADHVRQLK